MRKIRESCEIDAGTYQWEWLDDRIVVCKWDVPPASTDQWVTIAPRNCRFKLVGSCNEDISVVELKNDQA